MMQYPKPLRHFTKNLFLVSRAFNQRKTAKEEIYAQLQKMRKSIIRMNLTYTDIDRLKQKIDLFITLEGKYAIYFRQDDDGKQQLQKQINSLQQELKNEREEKLRIISEHDEKIKEMADSLESIKNRMKHMLMEKAKRQHRLNALEGRINKNIDRDGYFSS